MNKITILFGFLTTLLVARPGRAADILWTNTVGGNWNVAANWDPNQVPGAADTAVITNAGNYTVTMDASPTIAGLVVGATSGGTTQTLAATGQTLTLNGQVTVNAHGQFNFNSGNWNGATVLSGTVTWANGQLAAGSALTVATNGVLNLSGTDNILYGALTNSGVVNWQEGQISLYANYGAAVWNQSGAQWHIQCDQPLQTYNGTAPFNNAGWLVKTTTSGTTACYAALNNSGLVQAQSGTIQFNNGGNLGGNYLTSPGAVINFSGTLAFVSPITNFVASGVTISGLSNLVGTARLTNCTINGSELLVGSVTWANGQLAAGSALTVATNGVLNLSGTDNILYGALTNSGVVNWQEGQISLYANYGAAVWNQSGAQWHIQCDQPLQTYNGTAPFNNAGWLVKTTTSGTTACYAALNNSGLVQAQSGTIQFNNGGNLGGNYLTSPGAVINFSGTLAFVSPITNFVASGVTISGLSNLVGTARLTNCTINGSELLVGSVTWANGQLAAGSALTVATNGVLNLSGTDNILYGALTNSGVVNWQEGQISLYANYGAAVWNQSGAQWHIQCDQPLQTYNGTAPFNNAGWLVKTTTSGTTACYAALNNSGLVQAQSGTIQFNNGGNLGGNYLTSPGAVINFSGTLAFVSPITNFVASGVTISGLSNLVGTARLTNCTINGSELLVGSVTWANGQLAAGSALTVATNGVLNLGGTDNILYGLLTNSGVVNWQEGQISLYANYGAAVWNQSGAQWHIQCDQPLQTYNGTAPFNNAGWLVKTTTSGTTACYAALNNSGLVDVSKGQIALNGGSTLTGAFHFRINSASDFGSVAVAGTADLSGLTAQVTLHTNYAPQTGEAFTLVTYGSLGNPFSGVSLPTTAAWQTNYGPSAFTVAMVNVRPAFEVVTNPIINEMVPCSLDLAAQDPDVSQPRIVGLALPEGSMDASCRPLNESLWSVSAPPYPLNPNGIGALVEETSSTGGGFVLHDHVYLASQVPDPARAVVTYEFDQPATVDQLVVVQHGNGISRVEGFVGENTNSLTSIGSVFGPDGDVGSFAEGQLYTFRFTNGLAGKYFRFVIRKTSLADGYALYRAYPSDAAGGHIKPAVSQRDTLTYSLLAGPAGAEVNGTNGLFQWTPGESQGPGTNLVTVVVADDGTPALSATNTFTIYVNEVNVAPVLLGQTNRTINELTLLTVTNTATDADLPANTLTYSLLTAPSGAVMATNGVITWTPTEAQGPSTNTFTTRVVDNGSPALAVTNTFTVVVNEVNVAPVLTVPANQTINEQTALNVTATATDADLPANTLTFALVSGPAGLNVAANGAITWTPTEAQGPSTNTVTVRVHDNGTPVLAATNSFTVTVNEVNVAPVLPVQTNRTINELTLLTVTNAATDADIPANSLTYSLLTAPAGAVIATNGVITWTPTEAQGPSTNTFTTRVVDNGTPALSATNTFTVVVNEVNVAPVLGTLSNPTVNPGQTINFTAVATDADSPTNILAFSLLSPPAGASLDSGGHFNWRPTVAQANTTNAVQIRVTDNGSPTLSDTQSFTVVVNPLAPTELTTVAFTNGQFKLQVSGPAGLDYVIMVSSNLTSWTEAVTNLAPAMPFQYTDTNASSATNRFYRVRLAP